MRWVSSAVIRPHKCACIPFIGGTHPKGFFDFGTEIMAFDGHVYVSAVAAEQMAQALGWAPVKTPDEGLRERLADTERERDELRERFEAIDILASEGFRARKVAGRKKVA